MVDEVDTCLNSAFSRSHLTRVRRRIGRAHDGGFIFIIDTCRYNTTNTFLNNTPH